MDILRQNPVMNAKALAYAVYGDDYHPDDAAVKLRGVIYQMVRAGIKVEHVTGLGRNGNGYRLL